MFLFLSFCVDNFPEDYRVVLPPVARGVVALNTCCILCHVGGRPLLVKVFNRSSNLRRAQGYLYFGNVPHKSSVDDYLRGPGDETEAPDSNKKSMLRVSPYWD